MKRIFGFFLLFSIFLASCATPETAVPTATFTVTSVPSSTSTAIPATPTATEDPLKNAPEGTTRVSEDGKTFYKDIIDPTTEKAVIDPNTNEPLYETWAEYKNKAGEVLWSGWVVEKTRGGVIPLLDYRGIKTMTYRLFTSGINDGSVPIVLHESNPLDKDPQTNSFMGEFWGAFHDLVKSMGIPVDTILEMTTNANGSAAPGIDIPIIASNGRDVLINVGPRTELVTIIVPNEQLNTDVDPLAEEVQDSEGTRIWTKLVGVDESGSPILLISTAKPISKYSDQKQREILLFILNIFMVEGFSSDKRDANLFQFNIRLRLIARGTKQDSPDYFELIYPK